MISFVMEFLVLLGLPAVATPATEALQTESTIAIESTPKTAVVSYYGSKGGFFEGRPTASGRRFYRTDPIIAAHVSLPFGTEIELTNPSNGLTHVVTVLDRGPCHDNREFDVSEAAAIKLGFKRQGVATLEYRITKMGDRPYPALRCGKYERGDLRYG